MKPENWIALGSVVITAALTATGLLLSPRFAVKQSLKQFQKQRHWELAHKDFGEITSSLIKLRSYAYGILDVTLGTTLDGPSNEEVQEINRIRHRLEVLSHSPFISDSLGKRLAGILVGGADLSEAEDDPYERTERYSGLIEKLLHAVKAEAHQLSDTNAL